VRGAAKVTRAVCRPARELAARTDRAVGFGRVVRAGSPICQVLDTRQYADGALILGTLLELVRANGHGAMPANVRSRLRRVSRWPTMRGVRLMVRVCIDLAERNLNTDAPPASEQRRPQPGLGPTVLP
jgi:hypothetical protein